MLSSSTLLVASLLLLPVELARFAHFTRPSLSSIGYASRSEVVTAVSQDDRVHIVLGKCRRQINLLVPLLSALAVVAPVPSAIGNDLAIATFSAGDPRLLQPFFDDIAYKGVTASEIGSIGGTPAIRITYKPEKVSFKRIMGAFLRGCDPTSKQQFGNDVPPIMWVNDANEQASAEEAMRLLQKSTKVVTETSPPMFKGKSVVAEVRPIDGEWLPGEENDQSWYKKDSKSYDKLMKKSGRAKWLSDNYEPVTVTACKDRLCGYVYFPCNDENGCIRVLDGEY